MRKSINTQDAHVWYAVEATLKQQLHIQEISLFQVCFWVACWIHIAGHQYKKEKGIDVNPLISGVKKCSVWF